LESDPRVAQVYRDSDGWWCDMADGWRNGFDEPRGALHGIHEDRLRDILRQDVWRRQLRLRPCVDRLARKAAR
jgi:hypothetical protein